MIAVLLAVLILVVTNPRLGVDPQPVPGTHWRAAAVMLTCGVAVAFYDGIIGPGTGIFLAVAFTTLLGLDYVTASAHTKVVNAATNFGALMVFAVQGHVWWPLGLAMGAATITGAWIGAHMAMSGGSKFVRIVLLVVVSALLARLSWYVFVSWRG